MSDNKPYLPWEKQHLQDLSKYDWLTAVCQHHQHKNRSRDLRVAIALMQHAREETKLAWPTQRTLMLYAGTADQRQIRSAIASLCGSGAILKMLISELNPDIREQIKRSARGKVYRLNVFWAFEVFEGSRKMPSDEPAAMKAGRQRKRTIAVRSNGRPAPDLDRTDIVRDDGTNTVRPSADEHSPTYLNDIPKDPAKSAFEGKQDLASTRERNPYAVAKAKWVH